MIIKYENLSLKDDKDNIERLIVSTSLNYEQFIGTLHTVLEKLIKLDLINFTYDIEV